IHGNTLIIPAARMKGKDGKARAGGAGCYRIGAALQREILFSLKDGSGRSSRSPRWGPASRSRH
ncbi:MAG: hypothetical protein WAK72_02735, partial [Pseudolabrys sp.]